MRSSAASSATSSRRGWRGRASVAGPEHGNGCERPTEGRRATVLPRHVVTGSLQGSAAPVQRVLIDCDPGMDDAVALLWALHSPELRIEAITAATGNLPADRTSANVRKILDLA